ncbi:hypothetical protein KEM54_000974 [Ascosphaera aggregata]|nr:hypothetical protein KEM54_000974 [Ascosphaera aggregata]
MMKFFAAVGTAAAQGFNLAEVAVPGVTVKLFDALIGELKGLSHDQIVQIETAIQQGRPPENVIGVATGLVYVVTNVVACLGNGLGDVDEELKQL